MIKTIRTVADTSTASCFYFATFLTEVDERIDDAICREFVLD
jgi:hypothetical protein